jgi:hypothetical protein
MRGLAYRKVSARTGHSKTMQRNVDGHPCHEQDCSSQYLAMRHKTRTATAV